MWRQVDNVLLEMVLATALREEPGAACRAILPVITTPPSIVIRYELLRCHPPSIVIKYELLRCQPPSIVIRYEHESM